MLLRLVDLGCWLLARLRMAGLGRSLFAPLRSIGTFTLINPSTPLLAASVLPALTSVTHRLGGSGMRFVAFSIDLSGLSADRSRRTGRFALFGRRRRLLRPTARTGPFRSTDRNGQIVVRFDFLADIRVADGRFRRNGAIPIGGRLSTAAPWACCGDA